MPIRFDLKNALAEKFGTQIEASKALGIRESRLSYLVRGHALPTEAELKILRAALGRNLVSRVFGKSTVVPSEEPPRAAS